MVSEEVKKLDNNRKPGIFAALIAMFSSDNEKLDENVEKEVEGLRAESAKNIEAIQNRILSDKKQRRNKLSEDLKPAKINKIDNSAKSVNKSRTAQKEKDTEEREL